MLSQMSASTAPGTSATNSKKDQLEAANEVLEAYGNAKTCRNDNSSRFGKYSQLFFSGSPHTVTALKVEHYLLERSRLVTVPKGERNYHILHYLAHEEQGVEFSYLDGTKGITLVNGTAFDDAKDFEALKDRMESAGFDDELQNCIYSCIKGIMYMGNTQFDEVVKEGNDATVTKQSDHFKKACELLKIEPDRLSAAITTKEVRVGKDRTVSPVNKKTATAQRDTVAKTVYSRVFDMVVDWLNQNMGGSEGVYGDMPCIGMLDIFGFEDMPVNGFEQMFINLTNEWIQDHFNNVMFKREMDVYEEEGIGKIEFKQPNNFSAVELFINDTNPVGIIKVLQENVVNKGSSRDGAALVDFMKKGLKGTPNYEDVDSTMLNKVMKSKKAKWGAAADVKLDFKATFAVKHYAGTIVYFCDEFLPKSQDSMAEHLSEAIESSGWQRLSELFKSSGDAKSKKQMTVGMYFKQQLKSLVESLRKGQSLFVRCIKPNSAQLPGRFQLDLVIEQLVCGGVMSALEMRRAGLPDRMTYEEFCLEFGALRPPGVEGDSRAQCRGLMELLIGKEDATPVMYKFGHTRIFLRSGVLNILRESKAIILKRCAMIVARKWRMKTGLQTIASLAQLEGRVAEVEQQAVASEVDGVKSVNAALVSSTEAINSAYSQIEQLAGKWEEVKGHQERAKNATLKKEHEVLVGQMNKVDLKSITAKVDAAEEIIKTVCRRRQAADDAIGELVTAKRIDVNAQIARIDEVLKYCQPSEDGNDPPEQQELYNKCNKVKQKLTEIIDVQLPELIEDTLAGVDLNTDTPKIELPKEAEQLVQEGSDLVGNTEQGGKDLVEARKRFVFETMRKSPELQSLQQQQEEAKTRLEYLGDDAKDFVKEGLNSVCDAIAAAQQAQQEVEDTIEEGTNADRLVSAIKGFLAKEDLAQKAVETAKRLEEEAKAREGQNLRNILQSFPQIKQLVQVYQALMEQMEAFTIHVEDREDVENVDGLGMEQTVLAELKEKLLDAQESLDNMGLDVMNGEMAAERLRFKYKGPWSVECFKLLGPTIASHQDLACQLDEKRFTNVMDAVEALNAGVIQFDDGYCIGWSSNWNQFYMLFQTDKEVAVSEMLEKRRIEIATKARDEKLSKVTNAVDGALRAIESDTFQAQIQAQREAMEKQIRDRMHSEMIQGYNEKAEAEVEAKTQQVKDEIFNEVATAEANLKAAEEEKLRARQVYEEQIAELEARLQAARAKTGIEGEVPSLHKELSDTAEYCGKIRGDLHELLHLAKQETADVEESLAFMDALINNPKTLPGFHQFVDVLGRCQKRHAQSEDISLEAGMKGQHLALQEAREQMIQVASRIKKICDGSAKYGNGLEQALLDIQARLRNAQKTFDMLSRVFEGWTKRVDSASDHIDLALECLDVRLLQVEGLQEKPRPNGSKTQPVWKRVVANVMENIVAAPQPNETEGGSPKDGKAVKGLLGFTNPSSSTHVDIPRRAQYSVNIGDIVEDLATRQLRGVVRYVGPTKFAAGEWIGIELEGPYGKTDGSVNGFSYFQCSPDCGLFLRPKGVQRVYNAPRRR